MTKTKSKAKQTRAELRASRQEFRRQMELAAEQAAAAQPLETLAEKARDGRRLTTAELHRLGREFITLSDHYNIASNKLTTLGHALAKHESNLRIRSSMAAEAKGVVRSHSGCARVTQSEQDFELAAGLIQKLREMFFPAPKQQGGKEATTQYSVHIVGGITPQPKQPTVRDRMTADIMEAARKVLAGKRKANRKLTRNEQELEKLLIEFAW